MSNTIFLEIPNPIYELMGIKGENGYLEFKVDLDDDTPDRCLTTPKAYFEIYSDSYVNNQGFTVIPIKLNYEQVKKLMISFNLLGRVGSVLKDFLLEEGLLTEENYAFKSRENYFNLGDLTTALFNKKQQAQQTPIKSLYYSKSRTSKDSEESYFRYYNY